MGIVFDLVVFDGAISGTDPVTSPGELDVTLAQAETYYVAARYARASGTSPTLTVALEHTNDGAGWATKSTPINAEALSAGVMLVKYGIDDGSTSAGGALVRVKTTLGGTDPAANLQIRVCGRTSR